MTQLEQGGWNRWSLEVRSNLNHSVILPSLLAPGFSSLSISFYSRGPILDTVLQRWPHLCQIRRSLNLQTVALLMHPGVWLGLLTATACWWLSVCSSQGVPGLFLKTSSSASQSSVNSEAWDCSALCIYQFSASQGFSLSICPACQGFQSPHLCLSNLNYRI